jgi:hypothetical protein
MFPLSDLPAYARLFVKRTPSLYRPAKRLAGHGDAGQLCDRTTDLCIEGYPSSGNSFSFALLRIANDRLRIAHHCHSVANFRLALGYGVPAVCLIRDPEDAIASRLARFKGNLRSSVLEYIDFYDFALEHRDRLTIVTFEELTGNTAAFLERVAQASGQTFDLTDIERLKQKAVAYITRWSKQHGDPERISLPSSRREISKAQLRESIRGHRRFRDARCLWEEITRLLVELPAAPAAAWREAFSLRSTI